MWHENGVYHGTVVVFLWGREETLDTVRGAEQVHMLVKRAGEFCTLNQFAFQLLFISILSLYS